MFRLKDEVAEVGTKIFASEFAVNIKPAAGRREPEEQRCQLVLSQACIIARVALAFILQAPLEEILQRQTEVVRGDAVFGACRVKESRAADFKTGRTNDLRNSHESRHEAALA